MMAPPRVLFYLVSLHKWTNNDKWTRDSTKMVLLVEKETSESLPHLPRRLGFTHFPSFVSSPGKSSNPNKTSNPSPHANNVWGCTHFLSILFFVSTELQDINLMSFSTIEHCCEPLLCFRWMSNWTWISHNFSILWDFNQLTRLLRQGKIIFHSIIMFLLKHKLKNAFIDS